MRLARRGLLSSEPSSTHQLSAAADVLLREAEATLYALRATMRQASISSATRETQAPREADRLRSQHVLPRHLQVGDRQGRY